MTDSRDTSVEAGGGFVTRFAPSPTGLLHRGHAFSALTAFVRALFDRMTLKPKP